MALGGVALVGVTLGGVAFPMCFRFFERSGELLRGAALGGVAVGGVAHVGVTLGGVIFPMFFCFFKSFENF